MDENSKKSPKSSKRLVKKKKKIAQPTSRPVSLGDPELDALFSKIYAMKDDLDSKMSKLREITGMTGQDISNYINNPDNFSRSQWEKMEKDRKAAEDLLYAGLGKETRAREKKKKIEKEDKVRRGKTLGARKKWLQM